MKGVDRKKNYELCLKNLPEMCVPFKWIEFILSNHREYGLLIVIWLID